MEMKDNYQVSLRAFLEETMLNIFESYINFLTFLGIKADTILHYFHRTSSFTSNKDRSNI